MSVTLRTTHGKVKIEVFCEEVPASAKNFLALCASGNYNNTIFHRNIKGFIIQGGDETGSGKGGTSIYGKNFPDEFHPNLKHDKRGVVSMANSGPNTNNSQFFITYAKHMHLNDTYTIIGKVIDGFESLDLMEREPVDSKDKPLNEIKLYDVVMHANPIAENEQI